MDQSKAPKYDRDLGKHSFVQEVLVDHAAKDNIDHYKNRYNKHLSSDPVNFREG